MRRACSVRLQALILGLLLASGCAAKTNATTDDASISTRVKIALLNTPQVGTQRLEAKTFQGVVTLSGTVRSQAEADQAIAAARKIKGVRDVKSELRIVTNPRS
jgi:osmotically-inducible protein OsmY